MCMQGYTITASLLMCLWSAKLSQMEDAEPKQSERWQIHQEMESTLEVWRHSVEGKWNRINKKTGLLQVAWKQKKTHERCTELEKKLWKYSYSWPYFLYCIGLCAFQSLVIFNLLIKSFKSFREECCNLTRSPKDFKQSPS